jgi:hypothetical protein
MRTALVGLIATAITAAPIVAQAAPQVTSPSTLVSLAGGLAFGSPDVGGYGSLSVSHRAGDVIVRYAETSDIAIFGLSESVRDISLLYGRRTRWERGWARAAGGLGYVRHLGEEVEEVCSPTLCSDEQVPRSGFGFAAQLDAVWAPGRNVGVGVGAVGNLNGQKALAAVTLSIHLGRMR